MSGLIRVGHKGADHVAPGNTAASFEAALEHGVDMIEFEDDLTAAGLIDIEINETHRVHEHATSAIVRARKPA
jgi:hypothetical protein